jgi:integrase/recombinase XerD
MGQRRVHLPVLFILDVGLRISETLNLRHADIDYDNLILKVFGKGQKERLVPFSPELRKRLYRFEQFKTRKGIRSELVFVGSRRSRWEKRNSTTSLYLLQRKLGLSTFGRHRLRHTFATNYRPLMKLRAARHPPWHLLDLVVPKRRAPVAVID